jgi:shikimate kinase
MKPPLGSGAPCLKKWYQPVEYTQTIPSAGRLSGVPSRHFQRENSLSIIFVGLPGSGKTTIGRQLARRLDLPFVDSDHVIERQLGCSIRAFFDREGEDIFRDVEQQVLDELTRTHHGVIATGGGAVLREANRRHVHERGQVIYLRSTPEDVFRRLRHDKARPLLQVGDPLARLRALLEVRDPLYREAAHFVIETGRPSVAMLVNMITMQLELAGHLPAHDRAPPAAQPPPL